MHQHASVCIIIESAYNLYIESPLSLLHAMWCPDGIGRESWVWVVAPPQGESMTPPPPQWGGVCSSKGSHRREQTERPQNEIVVVVVVVAVVVVVVVVATVVNHR